jgi:hypothetical protein
MSYNVKADDYDTYNVEWLKSYNVKADDYNTYNY